MPVVPISACTRYSTVGNPSLRRKSAEIPRENFEKAVFTGPGLPRVRVVVNNDNIYDVILFLQVSVGLRRYEEEHTYTVVINSDGSGTVTSKSGLINVGFPLPGPGYYSPCGGASSPNGTANTITFTRPGPDPTNKTGWYANDVYDIRLVYCCPDNVEVPALRVTLNRTEASLQISGGGAANITDTDAMENPQASVLQEQPSCTGCSCFTADSCGKFRVPYIDISGSTTADNSDVGPIQFTICDEITYYKKKCNTRCGMYYIDPAKVRQTKILRTDTSMVSVVRGEGNTLFEKVGNIWLNEDIPLEFEEFYENIILYGMAKFLFCYLVTGTFDINCLLGKYNDSLIRRLGKSRFCTFVETFLDCNTSAIYDYNKYFLFDK